jgi:hypothetical protein
MATSPQYTVNDVVYLRESAAMGFLEAVKVSGVHLGQTGWLYTFNIGLTPPSPGGAHLDRRSNIGTQTLYFTEDELVLYCEAIRLAEDNAKRAYESFRAQRLALCPDELTDSG